MDPIQFDKLSTLFATRRSSRRKAIQQGAAGLAAGLVGAGVNAAAAQDGTPAAGEQVDKTEFLFVQSFQSGAIAPKDDEDGAYTVTFEHGLGQTLFFSNRPERIVGAMPTVQFLESLGFSPDNPPNAAVVIGAEDGGVDIAVVELTNPSYDVSTFTATYDVRVLKNYSSVDMPFQETSADLDSISTPFGAAHLFIDDCEDSEVYCRRQGANGYVYSSNDPTLGVRGKCWNWNTWICEPCGPEALRSECYSWYPNYCNDATPCWPRS